MSRPDDTTSARAAPDRVAPATAPASADSAPATGEQLAHELANLLDGSLRNLGLAIHTLRDTSSAPSDNLVQRLETASRAMQQMATLIQRWMSPTSTQASVFQESRTLGQLVEHAIQWLDSQARSQGVELRQEISPTAAALPAGPLYPVIDNAVRNSIEAIRQSDQPSGHVEVIARVEARELHLTIRDDGPGIAPGLLSADGRLTPRPGRTTKPDGHGLGLALAQEIALGLRGRLHLTNRSPRGAQLEMVIPIDSLFTQTA